jgi:thiaminase/transcriptional activator TenA
MTTRDSFTHAIRAKAQAIWDRELKHPFVRGLGDGTLPIDRFRFYLAQDYVFLIEYCRVFALGAAKARDLQTIAVFARLLDETLNTEMQLHRNYCHRLGIAERSRSLIKRANCHPPGPLSAMSAYFTRAKRIGSRPFPKTDIVGQKKRLQGRQLARGPSRG